MVLIQELGDFRKTLNNEGDNMISPIQSINLIHNNLIIELRSGSHFQWHYIYKPRVSGLQTNLNILLKKNYKLNICS